jgi:hypothetical protein
MGLKEFFGHHREEVTTNAAYASEQIDPRKILRTWSTHGERRLQDPVVLRKKLDPSGLGVFYRGIKSFLTSEAFMLEKGESYRAGEIMVSDLIRNDKKPTIRRLISGAKLVGVEPLPGGVTFMLPFSKQDFEGDKVLRVLATQNRSASAVCIIKLEKVGYHTWASVERANPNQIYPYEKVVIGLGSVPQREASHMAIRNLFRRSSQSVPENS